MKNIYVYFRGLGIRGLGVLGSWGPANRTCLKIGLSVYTRSIRYKIIVIILLVFASVSLLSNMCGAKVRGYHVCQKERNPKGCSKRRGKILKDLQTVLPFLTKLEYEDEDCHLSNFRASTDNGHFKEDLSVGSLNFHMSKSRPEWGNFPPISKFSTPVTHS